MRSGPRNEPFVTHHVRYDEWFERHRAAYLSELLAVRVLLPWNGRGLEIGVGTGRFAGPLGVEFGIDPAVEMLGYARARGVCVVRAVAEALPFARAVFDYALIVTTICFVEDAAAMLAEAHRVLKPGGELVIGFIDRTSGLGQHYLDHQAENVFYREANFTRQKRCNDSCVIPASPDPCGHRRCPSRWRRPRDRTLARRSGSGGIRGREGQPFLKPFEQCEP